MAEPAQRADHLVGDQQDAELVADLADPLEVAVLGWDAAAGVLERLEDHGGDRVRPLELDPFADPLGGPEVVAVRGPAQMVGVRDVRSRPASSGSNGTLSGVIPVAVSAPIVVPW